MSDESQFDGFGKKRNGRNYHYKIPLDDKRAMSKLRIAEKVLNRWFTRDSSMKRDGKIDGMTHIQTKDKKGPLPGLGKYEYSKDWEYPFGLGRMENLRARPNTSGGGGSKIKGTIPAFDRHGFEYSLGVSFVSELTMSQLRDMDDSAYDTITEDLRWAEEDAHEERQEAIAAEQEACEHKHSVTFDEPQTGEQYHRIGGYCEDCGVEFETE